MSHTQVANLQRMLKFLVTFKKTKADKWDNDRFDAEPKGKQARGCVLHHMYHAGLLSDELTNVIRENESGFTVTIFEEIKNQLEIEYGEGSYDTLFYTNRTIALDIFIKRLKVHIASLQEEMTPDESTWDEPAKVEYHIDLLNGDIKVYEKLEDAQLVRVALASIGRTVRIQKVTTEIVE